jgi:hypothetical protein
MPPRVACYTETVKAPAIWCLSAVLPLLSATAAPADQAQVSLVISVTVQPSCVVRTAAAGNESIVAITCSPSEISRVRMSRTVRGQTASSSSSAWLPLVTEAGTAHTTVSGSLVQIDF